MLDVPGWFDIHRLPKATAVVCRKLWFGKIQQPVSAEKERVVPFIRALNPVVLLLEPFRQPVRRSLREFRRRRVNDRWDHGFPAWERLLKSGLMLAPWKVGEIRSLMFVSIANAGRRKRQSRLPPLMRWRERANARAMNQTMPQGMRFNIASTRR